MPILYTAKRDADLNQYANRVLSKELNRTIQIMSDVWAGADYALVWDDEKNAPVNVCVNVYDMNPSDWRPAEIVVDATDEVKSLYRQWKIDREVERRVERFEDAAVAIEKGAIAKVVRGRNGKGTIGKVVVQMDAPYRMGYRSSMRRKVAIATSDVKVKKALRNGKVADVYQDVVWAWAMNCQRMDVAKPDREAIRKEVAAAMG